jgi:hypothetical protein
MRFIAVLHACSLAMTPSIRFRSSSLALEATITYVRRFLAPRADPRAQQTGGGSDSPPTSNSQQATLYPVHPDFQRPRLPWLLRVWETPIPGLSRTIRRQHPVTAFFHVSAPDLNTKPQSYSSSDNIEVLPLEQSLSKLWLSWGWNRSEAGQTGLCAPIRLSETKDNILRQHRRHRLRA